MYHLSYKSNIIKHKCTNAKRQTKYHEHIHQSLSLLDRRTRDQCKGVNVMILGLGFPIVIKDGFTLSICKRLTVTESIINLKY